jgi:hypothetical protein
VVDIWHGCFHNVDVSAHACVLGLLTRLQVMTAHARARNLESALSNATAGRAQAEEHLAEVQKERTQLQEMLSLAQQNQDAATKQRLVWLDAQLDEVRSERDRHMRATATVRVEFQETLEQKDEELERAKAELTRLTEALTASHRTTEQLQHQMTTASASSRHAAEESAGTCHRACDTLQSVFASDVGPHPSCVFDCCVCVVIFYFRRGCCLDGSEG